MAGLPTPFRLNNTIGVKGDKGDPGVSSASFYNQTCVHPITTYSGPVPFPPVINLVGSLADGVGFFYLLLPNLAGASTTLVNRVGGSSHPVAGVTVDTDSGNNFYLANVQGDGGGFAIAVAIDTVGNIQQTGMLGDIGFLSVPTSEWSLINQIAGANTFSPGAQQCISIFGSIMKPLDSTTYGCDPPVFGAGPLGLTPPLGSTGFGGYLWFGQEADPTLITLGNGYQGMTQDGAYQTIVPPLFDPGAAWLSQGQSKHELRIGDVLTGPSEEVTYFVPIPSSALGTTVTVTATLTAKISNLDVSGAGNQGGACTAIVVGTFSCVEGNLGIQGATTTLVTPTINGGTAMTDVTLVLATTSGQNLGVSVTSGATIGAATTIAVQLDIVLEVN